MGRIDLGQYAFLYRELLLNIEHIEKVNEGELGHSRILIGTRGPKYGQHRTAAPATARAFPPGSLLHIARTYSVSQTMIGRLTASSPSV